MPTQLYNNSAIYFMCARDFLWAGKEYQMGDKFDQDIAPGRLDMLVRTRRLTLRTSRATGTTTSGCARTSPRSSGSSTVRIRTS
jgi:hypothetical protein